MCLVAISAIASAQDLLGFSCEIIEETITTSGSTHLRLTRERPLFLRHKETVSSVQQSETV
jgi:hypothetical protein